MMEPEEERIALWALFATLVFGVFGIAIVIGGTGIALVKLVQWALS